MKENGKTANEHEISFCSDQSVLELNSEDNCA